MIRWQDFNLFADSYLPTIHIEDGTSRLLSRKKTVITKSNCFVGLGNSKQAISGQTEQSNTNNRSDRKKR